MIAPKESKNLRKSAKRTMYFLICIFFFCLVEAYLLQLAGLSAIWTGVIIIITAAIFYLIFLFICAKIDKNKEEKARENKTKDPFSR